MTVNHYVTYEEFLDSHVTTEDLYYLEDEELARTLVELGYRGSGAILTRKEFLQQKYDKKPEVLQQPTVPLEPLKLRNLSDPFLRKLSKREGANKVGKLKTIIFLQVRNNKGQEISSYVDFSHRLQQEDFHQYFTGQKKLMPKLNDLSVYNWATNKIVSTSSPNFDITYDAKRGIRFLCKLSKQEINLQSLTNIKRLLVTGTPNYIHAVIYDHRVNTK